MISSDHAPVGWSPILSLEVARIATFLPLMMCSVRSLPLSEDSIDDQKLLMRALDPPLPSRLHVSREVTIWLQYLLMDDLKNGKIHSQTQAAGANQEAKNPVQAILAVDYKK